MTEIQSIIFPKNKFCSKCAEKWLKEHNYSTAGKRIKNWNSKNFWRYRQKPPGHFKVGTLYTKKLRNGVQMILGDLKTKS